MKKKNHDFSADVFKMLVLSVQQSKTPKPRKSLAFLFEKWDKGVERELNIKTVAYLLLSDCFRSRCIFFPFHLASYIHLEILYFELFIKASVHHTSL